MKQLIKNAHRATIVLFAIFVLGCEKKEELPKVTSSFTSTVNNTTGAVTFKNTSTNATIYLWDLGDGTTSTQFEPAKTYQTGTYTVKLTASNTAGGTATSENTFTVTLPGPPVDTTKPIITLVGDATINLTIGDPYTDKGATANDNLDGNITSKIVKAGTVNTAAAGTYTITYDVTDLAGNTAVRVSRSVIVTAFDDGLLNNGAFSIVKGQAGDAWSGNAFNVINEGGTNFNFANVTAVGNAFDVNLSQVLPLVLGNNYILTFEASSDRARTMIAGIGLSVDPFTNDTKSVNLTTAKQTFTLNLSAAAFGGTNSRVIFDMGAALGTVVIDNVKLVEGPPTVNPLKLPIDFDSPGITYTFDVFNGASYQVVDNPQLSGVNNVASKVGRIINIGAQYEGGAFTLGTPVDFSTNKSIKMKIYSTVAVPVLLKFEGAGAPIETSVNHGGTGWEELTFDFTSSATFNKLVLFIDGPGTTAGTFYMDDIKQVATVGGPGACPAPPAGDLVSNGGFETGTTTCWTSFAAANNGTFAATNAQAKTGTFSGLLVANVPTGGPASFPVVKAANIGIGTITPGKSVTVTFDLYGSVAGAGGVVFVELFSELSGGGTSKAEILGGGPLFPNGTWTSKSYTTTVGSDVSGGITVQLKADCGANPGCRVEAYFDNVSVKINP
jgi:hypothetical protein